MIAGPAARSVGRPVGRRPVLTKGGGRDPFAGLPTDGLIAEWRFAEGSGTTVADEIGANDINLALPTNPNFTWTERGGSLLSGLIQTPTINNSRVVVVLYRTNAIVNGGGFLISGGSGSGAGVLQGTFPNTEIGHYGGGESVHPILKRSDTDQFAFELASGGWGVCFRTLTQAYNSAWGFGGRHSATSSRCAQFEIGWAGIYNKTLSDDERSQLFATLREVAKSRSVYIHNDDCPVQGELIGLIGESDASGRALVADLSAGDQAFDFSNTRIQAGIGSAAANALATMVLGTNQMATDGVHTAATKFGPEVGLVIGRASVSRDRPQIIWKTAKGSTFSAPSNSVGGSSPAVASTWNADEVFGLGLLSLALRDFYLCSQAARNLGIGAKVYGVVCSLTKNDATNTGYTTDAATYQARRQAIFDKVKAAMDVSSLKWIELGSVPTTGDNDTAYGHVSDGLAAFAAANPAEVSVIDMSGYALQVDGVHWAADGIKGAGASAIGLMSF